MEVGREAVSACFYPCLLILPAERREEEKHHIRLEGRLKTWLSSSGICRQPTSLLGISQHISYRVCLALWTSDIPLFPLLLPSSCLGSDIPNTPILLPCLLTASPSSPMDSTGRNKAASGTSTPLVHVKNSFSPSTHLASHTKSPISASWCFPFPCPSSHSMAALL